MMTLHDADYDDEDAVSQRKIARTTAQRKASQIREALERQYDAMLGPKQIRSTLSIVTPNSPRASAHDSVDGQRTPPTQTDEFIARENIKRFEAQLVEAAEGTRMNTIRQLLKDEKLHLRDGPSGR